MTEMLLFMILGENHETGNFKGMSVGLADGGVQTVALV